MRSATSWQRALIHRRVAPGGAQLFIDELIAALQGHDQRFRALLTRRRRVAHRRRAVRRLEGADGTSCSTSSTTFTPPASAVFASDMPPKAIEAGGTASLAIRETRRRDGPAGSWIAREVVPALPHRRQARHAKRSPRVSRGSSGDERARDHGHGGGSARAWKSPRCADARDRRQVLEPSGARPPPRRRSASGRLPTASSSTTRRSYGSGPTSPAGSSRKLR